VRSSTRRRADLLAAALVGLLAAGGWTGAAAAGPGAATDAAAPVEVAAQGLLVDAAWLSTHLFDPGVRVLDVRGDAFAYEAGHVPGSAYLERTALAGALGDETGAPPDAEALAALFREAGVSDSSTVVIYEASTGVWSARAFWALDHIGHADTRVLDGGWTKWTCEGLPAESGRLTPLPGKLEPRVREDALATEEWLLGRLGDATVVLLDVRSAAEYDGTEAMADRGGHIPGAVNLEWKELLAPDGSGTLLPLEAVRAAFAGAGVTPEREVVTYCQVGGRAAHTYFALRLAGFPRVRLYEGSWAEWGNDPDLPVETGP
jgi:thiosulfate/3-mercaptopyruvate sulfurtransferase